MSDWKLNTPVAFLIFNRPETTERVFSEIAKAKPPKLLVVADGPRSNRPGEVEKCAETRSIIDQVDWECEVLTNFSDVNLGCKKRVSSGLDWVFEKVPEAIILEDDCLPHHTFFRFCEELLELYRDDERISMISGDNFQFGKTRIEYSYYFSRYNHVWGWASWRRAWKYHDREATAWPELQKGGWLDVLISNPRERKYWAEVFQAVREGRIDTWDYQLTLAAWSQGMLTILPNVNLISNIGFGGEATHTQSTSIYSNMITQPMEFPLLHPEIVLPHIEADSFTSKYMYSSSYKRIIINKIKSYFDKFGI